jgi:hypothetical protein
MTPEDVKRRMALQARFEEGDLETVRQLASHFLELAIAATRSRPELSNYEVVGWNGEDWMAFAEGTKEYCKGFMTAIELVDKDRWQALRVICGEGVVWPEELWGANATLPPEEQQ